ncbi:hypothetical protein ACI6Q2_04460 [Chitinophagaceae bacterium LWZ2-11]
MKALLAVIFTALSFSCLAQSSCEKNFNLSMQTGYEMSTKLTQPAFTADFGLTGEKSPLCFYAGIRTVDKQWISPNITKTTPGQGIDLSIIPTVTAMYKWKRDYYESKLAHCFAAQLGTNNFYAFQYRCYLTTGETGRATIGGVFGYNSYNNFTIGVSFVGIF